MTSKEIISHLQKLKEGSCIGCDKTKNDNCLDCSIYTAISEAILIIKSIDE